MMPFFVSCNLIPQQIENLSLYIFQTFNESRQILTCSFNSCSDSDDPFLISKIFNGLVAGIPDTLNNVSSFFIRSLYLLILSIVIPDNKFLSTSNSSSDLKIFNGLVAGIPDTLNNVSSFFIRSLYLLILSIVIPDNKFLSTSNSSSEIDR